MRVSMEKIPKQQKRGIPKRENYHKNTITLNTFKKERNRRHWTGRLCGDLEIFQKRVLSYVNEKKPMTCEVCGIDSYTACGICKSSVKYFP